MKTLLLDNYDSFTYNLYQYLAELDEAPLVYRNDEVTLDEVRAMEVERIVISPGPGRPEEPTYFGVCGEVITALGPSTPLLGVCLGHQGIVHVLGGKIVRAEQVMHGKASRVSHDGAGLFAGLPSPFEAMRYHSLVADPEHLPECLGVTAWTDDGVIMGVQHRQWPLFGVQFHPESIGTDVGRALLRNFLGEAARMPLAAG